MNEVIEVKVARTHRDALLPTKGSVHAAGWDLYSLEDTTVKRRSSTMVRTGLHVAIPEGFEGQVRARSSLGKKGLILPHSICLLYTSPSPRDATLSRMPSSA